MLKVVIRFFVFLVFLFVILLIAGYTYIQSSFTDHIENMLAETMGTPVSVQSATLDIPNTYILIEGIQFFNPEGFPKGAIAKIPKILIDFDFESFLVQKVIIDYVEIDCQETHILRDSTGKINWFYIRSFLEGGKFQRTGFMAWMNDWPMEIHRFKVSIKKNTYTDFSQTPLFKKFRVLRLDDLEYQNLTSMMEITKIIVWETLIRVDQDELEEAFDLVEDKIEAKLGTRRDFLVKWHSGKSTEELLEETKMDIKSTSQPPLL